jgi:hypothetical protein
MRRLVILLAFLGGGCLVESVDGVGKACDPNHPCPGSLTCPAGVCVEPGTPALDAEQTGCVIGGMSYASGDPNPDDACQSCQPSKAPTDWSPSPNGTTCDVGAVCVNKACQSGCWIGSVFHTSGESNPGNGCQSCQPSSSTSAWTNLADGNPCGATAACLSGACTDCSGPTGCPGPSDAGFPGPSDAGFPGPSDASFPGPSDASFPGPSDASLPSDAASSPDASKAVDASHPPDAALLHDAGLRADAGSRPDAGTSSDAALPAGVTEVGSATAQGFDDAGTGISITPGIASIPGDVVLAVVHANALNTTVSDDNGAYAFSCDLAENTADTSTYAIMHRIAAVGEPASYAWTLSSIQAWSVQVRVYRGVDVSVWDVAPSTATRAMGLSSTTATAPTMTILTPGALGILLCLTDTSGGDIYSAPTNGYGDGVTPGRILLQETWQRTWATAGATGASVATLSSVNDWVAHQFALKPR